MAFTKSQKAENQKKLGQIIKDSASVVFVSFDKLLVADVNAIRRALKAENVGYTVAKKSLAKRALDASGIEGEMPEMKGQLAIVHGSDQLAPARSIYEFVKKMKEQLSIAGGIFEGSYRDAAAMTSIATIPPLDTLRGMFAQLVNSPRQRFAVVLSKVAETKTS